MGTYKGQGRWESKHTALSVGYGLKFLPWRWVSLDLGMTMFSYFRSEPTNLYYVDTGDTVYETEGYGLGTIWKLGLTFYF